MFFDKSANRLLNTRQWMKGNQTMKITTYIDIKRRRRKSQVHPRIQDNSVATSINREQHFHVTDTSANPNYTHGVPAEKYSTQDTYSEFQ